MPAGNTPASFGGHRPPFNYTVYILQCADVSYYTGCTSNLLQRLNRHEQGKVISTKLRRPVRLLSYYCFENKYQAYKFEKYLKSGSGRAFMRRHLV
ncbi:MAG: GIY-YIG nuclease family protein [Saprospiraceae bacterium]|nr:GIY-YIG nuclease family protein [Saprospiraceae bacterium]